MGCSLKGLRVGGGLTELDEAYFFSVLMAAPDLAAAFRAADPRMTVSRCDTPVPRTLEPILVTWSQSDILGVSVFVYMCKSVKCRGARSRERCS